MASPTFGSFTTAVDTCTCLPSLLPPHSPAVRRIAGHCPWQDEASTQPHHLASLQDPFSYNLAVCAHVPPMQMGIWIREKFLLQRRKYFPFDTLLELESKHASCPHAIAGADSWLKDTVYCFSGRRVVNTRIRITIRSRRAMGAMCTLLLARTILRHSVCRWGAMRASQRTAGALGPADGKCVYNMLRTSRCKRGTVNASLR
jgi:hypothetical protein